LLRPSPVLLKKVETIGNLSRLLKVDKAASLVKRTVYI
jgi:hypothetical protein